MYGESRISESRKGNESDMYTFDSRVRYSETDEEGNLSVVGIMNYLQDCSTFQSEDLKLGISYLNEEKRAWWLSGWQIEILRQQHFGERIRISTWPSGKGGFDLVLFRSGKRMSDPGAGEPVERLSDRGQTPCDAAGAEEDPIAGDV